MSENIVEIRKVCKSYGRQEVLREVSLKIPKNRVYGLLGANGAGKSTLLKMLSGLARPTSGEILFEGHSWSRKDLRQIGSLVETPPIYENLSAWENLKVRSLLLDIPESRIQETLEQVDLAETGKKKAGNFSLGMKQRLGIAVALLAEPRLLILDEPTNGLDPLGIRELRSLIRSFPQQGMTVIVSSHILSEIQMMADDIGILAQGRIGYEGSVTGEEDLEQLFLQVVEKGAAGKEEKKGGSRR